MPGQRPEATKPRPIARPAAALQRTLACGPRLRPSRRGERGGLEWGLLRILMLRPGALWGWVPPGFRRAVSTARPVCGLSSGRAPLKANHGKRAIKVCAPGDAAEMLRYPVALL